MNGQLAGMLDAIGAGPDLSRGTCVGRWDEWDEVEDQAVIDRTVALCLKCKVLDRCRQWIETTPVSRRASGVLAGEVHIFVSATRRTRHKTVRRASA